MNGSAQQPLKVSRELLSYLKIESFDVIKNNNNCVTIETRDYFYKIRKFALGDPTAYFEHILGLAFADEYRRLGLEWEYLKMTLNCDSYAIEKREKLKVLTQEECSIQEALLESSKVTRIVEKKLGFPHLVAQVRQEIKFEDVERIYVLRDAKPSHEDFAIKNGKIFALGSLNRFLGLSDMNGNWKNCKQNFAKPVNLLRVKCCFASKNAFKHRNNSNRFHLLSDGFWWIFSGENGAEIMRKRQEDILCLQKMNETNLEILTKGHACPVMSVDSIDIVSHDDCLKNNGKV